MSPYRLENDNYVYVYDEEIYKYVFIGRLDGVELGDFIREYEA